MLLQLNIISITDRQTIDAVSRLTLSELKEEASAYSVIGIDEGQFVSIFQLYIACIIVLEICSASFKI